MRWHMAKALWWPEGFYMSSMIIAILYMILMIVMIMVILMIIVFLIILMIVIIIMIIVILMIMTIWLCNRNEAVGDGKKRQTVMTTSIIQIDAIMILVDLEKALGAFKL